MKMEDMAEYWKDIEGYEGIYQVSTLGKIKALPVSKKYGRFEQKRKETILKPSIDKRGYHSVSLQKDGITKYCSVHRIVAEAFILNIENKPTTNHIDGDKSNNSVYNLEWATHKEQINHADKNGLRNIRGENSAVARATNEAVEYIRKNHWSDLKAQKSNTQELCDKFAISKTTIYNILRNRSWKHV